jgi:hypothetical protein
MAAQSDSTPISRCRAHLQAVPIEHGQITPYTLVAVPARPPPQGTRSGSLHDGFRHRRGRVFGPGTIAAAASMMITFAITTIMTTIVAAIMMPGITSSAAHSHPYLRT